ncbi:MAG: acyltransferase family protein [Bacteroidota bacterium]
MGIFSINSGHNRIFGLDLLRFLAIFFVLLGHGAILLPETYKSMTRMMILDGVGLFFVLSGFLIGQILLKQINRGETKFKDLFHFWSRRWMRTLPAYFFVLSLLLLYVFSFKADRLPENWYKYYLFIQNFNTIQPDFFQESWSLSIEEWFYLLVPILFFGFLFFFKKRFRATLLFLVLAVIAGILLYRFYLFQQYTGKDFQTDILLQVIPRLDAIMVGVSGAFCVTYYPKTWQKFNHWSWLPAMFAMLYLLKFLNVNDTGIYYCVFAPTLKAMSVLLMLPFLSGWKLSSSTGFSRVITFISITSYSIYLINRTVVIDIFIKFGIHGNLRNKHKAGEFWILEYLLFWALSVILAYVLYKAIEQPFMKLRRRES